MLELKKVKNEVFENYYEGHTTSGAKVVCVLDDNCVRYTAFDKNGKKTSKREYNNNEKQLCFRKATEALNRI